MLLNNRKAKAFMKILVVDDEVQLADAIVQILKQHKYEAEAVYDGEDGYHYAMTNLYDVIILDIMMPKMDGITLLKTIRREKISTPVLMLSAKSEIGDKVLGLNVGADDYLTKPFDSSELLARINAISRRKGEFMGDELVFDDLSLDKNAHELCSGGNKIQLSAKEYQIIEMLLKDAGKTLPKEKFVEKIWGFDSEAEYNTIEVYVSFLRKKISAIGSTVTIKSLRGIGYKLEKKDG